MKDQPEGFWINAGEAMKEHAHLIGAGGATLVVDLLVWVNDIWQYVDKWVVYATHALLLGIAVIAWRKGMKK